MSNKLNERKIIEALSGVRMPDSDDAITDAGNVSGIVIKDGHVSFTVEIDPKEKDKVDDWRRACEKAVLGVDKVLSATALFTAHQAGPDVNPKANDRGTPIGAGQQMETGPHQPAKPFSPAQPRPCHHLTLVRPAHCLAGPPKSPSSTRRHHPC